MYFIIHGYCDVFKSDIPVATLYDGQYFGELALLMQCRRKCSVRGWLRSLVPS